MFTGIIDHCGVIKSISHDSDNSLQLSISHQFSDLKQGESICVDGICLTVTHFDIDHFTCDVSPETLKLTIASHYAIGQQVNLERSLRLSDRLSGHIVTGHVDGILNVKLIQKQNDYFYCEFTGVNPKHISLLSTKGSVCINGVSLTINTLHDNDFSVMIIPHTLAITNLNILEDNSIVNIEYDYLAKLVQRNLETNREQKV